jgi:hypothetical protein
MTNNNINLGIEQICAAIINKYGKINIALNEILQDFSNKSIAVNQDLETKDLIFELVEKPTEEE